jgi:hypothetical protein
VKRLLDEGTSAKKRIDGYLERSKSPQNVRPFNGEQIKDELKNLVKRIERIHGAMSMPNKGLENEVGLRNRLINPVERKISAEEHKKENKVQFGEVLEDLRLDADLRAENLYLAVKNADRRTAAKLEFHIKTLADGTGVRMDKWTEFQSLADKAAVLNGRMKTVKMLSGHQLQDLQKGSERLLADIQAYRQDWRERKGVGLFEQPELEEVRKLRTSVNECGGALKTALKTLQVKQQHGARGTVSQSLGEIQEEAAVATERNLTSASGRTLQRLTKGKPETTPQHDASRGRRL